MFLCGPIETAVLPAGIRCRARTGEALRDDFPIHRNRGRSACPFGNGAPFPVRDRQGNARAVAAGGAEHSRLKVRGRVEYVSATDDEAVEAFHLLCKLEGISPALEPAHALAYVSKLAPTLPRDYLLVMNLCGRGDKDLAQIAPLAPPPQPRAASSVRALQPNPENQGGQNWTPIRGQS